MKALIFLSLLLIGVMAEAQYVKKSDVSTMITTAIKPLQVTLTTQATRIKTDSTINSNQDKLLLVQSQALIKFAADSVADKKRILLLETASVDLNKQLLLVIQNSKSKDSVIKALGDTLIKTRYYTKQLNDSIYMVKFRDSVNNLALQKQLDEINDVAVAAILEANKKDTLLPVPGEITLTKGSANSWYIGIYNYTQLIQRIQTLEAKKP